MCRSLLFQMYSKSHLVNIEKYSVNCVQRPLSTYVSCIRLRDQSVWVWYLFCNIMQICSVQCFRALLSVSSRLLLTVRCSSLYYVTLCILGNRFSYYMQDNYIETDVFLSQSTYKRVHINSCVDSLHSLVVIKMLIHIMIRMICAVNITMYFSVYLFSAAAGCIHGGPVKLHLCTVVIMHI